MPQTRTPDLRSTTTSPRSARKPKGRGGERREEILKQAERLFAARGVESVSTRQIAEAVGISQPSFYAYFDKRADLLDEVCARAFGKLAESGLAALRRGGDPVEQMIRAYIDFGMEQPDAYRIAFMLEGVYGAADKAHGAGSGRTHHVFEAFEMVRRMMASRLGPDHPALEMVSQSLWAATHGLVSLLIARPAFPWVERTALVNWHVEALLKSLPPPRR